jgi:hypothetical protein
LFEGQSFIKYGRHGKPHTRVVYLSKDSEEVVWCIRGEKDKAKGIAKETSVRKMKTE